MVDFAKGIKLKERNFDNGGSVINMSIDVSEIMENPINNDKYINVIIKRGKESGKLYAVNNDYYQKNNNKVETNNEQIVQFEEEEMPF